MEDGEWYKIIPLSLYFRLGIWLLIKGIPNTLNPPPQNKNRLILKVTHLSKHSLCVPNSDLDAKETAANVKRSCFLGDQLKEKECNYINNNITFVECSLCNRHKKFINIKVTQ